MSPATTATASEDLAKSSTDPTLWKPTNGSPLDLVNGDRKASVTPDRKERLLAEARADRIRWIQKVPLPYAATLSPSNNNENNETAEDPWTSLPVLDHFRQTQQPQLPSFTQLLSFLYEMDQVSPEEVATRVQSLCSMDEAALQDDQHTDPLVKAYRKFIRTLKTPECAFLCQGMRNFLRNLDDQHADTTYLQLKTYFESTFDSIQTYDSFKEQPEDLLRRSLESFIYGHAQAHLESALPQQPQQQQQWMERLDSLQFVTPAHLEIQALMEQTSLDDILKQPIQALLSVQHYYAPFEKLQRILALYKAVNEALTNVLKPALPSADDVLPTIILTVIRAKPTNLQWNLQLVEAASPPEHLRGEAGYAFTNLYGAVQFIKDLDLKEPSHLSITAEDFAKGLQACRQQRQQQQQQQQQQQDSPTSDDPPPTVPTVNIQEIRKARLAGEVIDLEWLLQENDSRLLEDSSVDTNDTSPLPEGFTRHYSFLSTRPEDIRVSDLPQLLAEYRMLVTTTEGLLAEKSRRAALERKVKLQQTQDKLYQAAQQVDPSLLPTPKRTRKGTGDDNSRIEI